MMGLLTYRDTANGGTEISVRLNDKLELPVGNLRFLHDTLLFRNSSLDFEVFAVYEDKEMEKLPHKQELSRLVDVTELHIEGPAGEYCVGFPKMRIYNPLV